MRFLFLILLVSFINSCKESSEPQRGTTVPIDQGGMFSGIGPSGPICIEYQQDRGELLLDFEKEDVLSNKYNLYYRGYFIVDEIKRIYSMSIYTGLVNWELSSHSPPANFYDNWDLNPIIESSIDVSNGDSIKFNFSLLDLDPKEAYGFEIKLDYQGLCNGSVQSYEPRAFFDYYDTEAKLMADSLTILTQNKGVFWSHLHTRSDVQIVKITHRWSPEPFPTSNRTSLIKEFEDRIIKKDSTLIIKSDTVNVYSGLNYWYITVNLIYPYNIEKEFQSLVYWN